MSTTASHIRLGNAGERAAARFLVRKGYELLGRNIHFEHAQVDLAARDGACFVLVEVKTLRYHAGREQTPAHNFAEDQQKRLRSAAREMMRKFQNPEYPVRCDLIEIFMGRFFPREIRHHINCFALKDWLKQSQF